MKSKPKLILHSSFGKLSVFAVLTALILGGCEKNTDATTSAEPSAFDKTGRASTQAIIGSGWTDITSSEEANYKVHLENVTQSSPVIRDWDGGALSWYLNSSGTMSNTFSSSNTTASYSYASSTKTHTFTLNKFPGNRSEIRVPTNYGPGESRQFEGTITLGNNVFADNAIFQIWGNSGTATLMQIRGNASANGGTLRVYQNAGSYTSEMGDRDIATNILNVPTKINIIHRQESSSGAGKVLIYVNDELKFSFTDNVGTSNTSGDTNYLKYGCYGREDDPATNDITNSVVKWSNVKIYEGGTEAAGTAYYKIRVLNNSNYVLNSASTSPVDGTNVNVYTSNSSDAQLWRLVPTSSGYVKIVSKLDSNLVVAPTSATFSNGINVNLDNWAGYNRQQWLITPLNDGSGASKISGRLNGSYVLDCSSTPANGTNVQIWTYTPNNRQQWIIEQVTSGNP